MLTNTGPAVVRSAAGLLSTVAWMDGSGQLTYALEGSVFVTGAAVQWLRDGLGLLDHAAQSEALARSVPDSGGVVFVPALTGLGAPDWDPDARGAIFGITRGTTRAHLVRATLEAIAFEVRDVADLMVEAGAGRPRAAADGGASANDLLMQLQADQLRCRWNARWSPRRPRWAPRSWPAWPPGSGPRPTSSRDLAARPRFEPGPRDDAAYARWRRAVTRAKGWAAPTGSPHAQHPVQAPDGGEPQLLLVQPGAEPAPVKERSGHPQRPAQAAVVERRTGSADPLPEPVLATVLLVLS